MAPVTALPGLLPTLTRRRSMVLVPALLLPLGACEGAPAAAPVPAAALREDLALWRLAVLDRHPRFHGQAQLDAPLEAAFAQAKQALDAPLPLPQAFVHLSRLNPFFRDAHTLLMPWLGGREPGAAQRERLFPFGVTLMPGGAPLPAGSRIVQINGQDAAALLQTLAAHSHGETAALRRHMLTLMWPLWLHAVLGWQDRFDLQLLTPDGQPLSRAVQADGAWQPDRVPPGLPTLQRLADGSALLRVPTFDVDDDPAAFERAVQQAFAGLRTMQATRLVIDVRGNTGGQSEAGATVIRPLIDRPVRQVSRARERLNADNNGWFGRHGAPGTLREFDVSREGLIEPLPEALRWRGRTAVLVDEMSYSATILFATALQDAGRATLVGRATGGHANQTGNMMPTRLPHTGFTAFIATREFVRPSGDTRAQPVQPDIVVADDAVPGHTADAVLERALSWLHQAP